MTKDGPVLIVHVHMLIEYGTTDCCDNYRDMCAKIGAMFSDTDAAYLVWCQACDFIAQLWRGTCRRTNSQRATVKLHAATLSHKQTKKMASSDSDYDISCLEKHACM